MLAAAAPTYRNEVAARSILTYNDYNPATALPRLASPVLLIASPADRFGPFSAVEHAAAADHVQLRTISGDHFSVYRSPVKEEAAEIAAGFLREVFGLATPAPQSEVTPGGNDQGSP